MVYGYTKLPEPRRLSQSVLDRPGLRCARRPHIHTSALYCSFHCGHGKSQCGTEGGGNGGQELWALQGPAMLGISLLTHTDLHMDINTHNLDLQRHPIGVEGGELSELCCPEKPTMPQQPFKL